MADHQETLKIIEHAATERRTHLYLGLRKLRKFPPQIAELTNLTSLDLSNNELTSIPTEVIKLKSLTKLNLSSNQLTDIAPAIFHLSNLKHLDLRLNKLRVISPEIARLTNLTNLNLGYTKLTRLPQEIIKLSHLSHLDISGNKLNTLPQEITELTNLILLSLWNNRLTSLPRNITRLTKLTTLNLSVNNLKTLPQEITKLTNLCHLELSANELDSLPLAIANLTQLTSLNLSYNNLTKLPTGITKLGSLTNLAIGYNQLTKLPSELAKLTNLTDLDLSGNNLTNLPPEISTLKKLNTLNLADNELKAVPLEVPELTNLTSLTLCANQLVSLPSVIERLVNLTDLYLGKTTHARTKTGGSTIAYNTANQLTQLPQEIAKLTNLMFLGLEGNALTSLPTEITSLRCLQYLDLNDNPLSISPETLANPYNVGAIFAALAGLLSGERLNEAKVLVVGDGDVGKSSVVERLIYNTFNPKKPTTLGVDINDEMKVVQSEVLGEGEQVKLNIWDFGGQEVQHSTHQFFLTTRSLYLLVVDARKGDQLTNIEYWLKLIESFGGDSPIIVVVNQIDELKGQRPLNLDRRALQEKYNIRAFVETSCKTGEGINALKTAIGHEVVQLKHVRDVWPREWLAIKRRLKEMGADYIPVETYLEICRKEKLKDEDLQQSLLDILHVLGTVVRFPGDTQVLNPRWVTQGVYSLLTSRQVVKSQGQFDVSEVGNILAVIPDAKKHYPPHTHERLIKVMRHFELCFEFTDRLGHYLIPRHLHDNEPDISWDDSSALKFQYHYETLPDSVISRFIVRMNQYIATSNYWKNGVYLESGNGEKNVAKIKADLVDRKIFISIIGKEQTRRAFLAVIRSVFDEINSNFKIEIEQKIPIPGYPQSLVSYRELLVYEEMNEQSILIPELRQKFSVRELLDGVEDLTVRMKRRRSESKNKRSVNDTDSEIQTPTQLSILRIVVASPTDVQAERDLLPSVIEEVNRGVAADRGLHLVLSRWETDAYPGFHSEGAQGLIDPILNISDCDLLIGIFWKRFGTFTSDGKTGTEHELSLAHDSWKEKGRPQIFVYFNEKPASPKSKAEIEQWGQVLAFKETFPKEGLWWPYKGKANFESLVRNHLANYIRTLK